MQPNLSLKKDRVIDAKVAAQQEQEEDDIEQNLLDCSEPQYLTRVEEQVDTALTKQMIEQNYIGAQSFSDEDFRYSHTFNDLIAKNKSRKSGIFEDSLTDGEEEKKDEKF